jgi:hypothetical protein
MPIDYKKGKIYKIVNTENNNIYYGSTIQPLHKRLNEHRNKHNNCMSKNLCVDLYNCSIVLVENFECNSKEELLMRERFYIENNVCVNKIKRPIVSKEEQRQREDEWHKNKGVEYNREKSKRWLENNKEKHNKRGLEWYHNNKDKRKEWYQKNIDKRKIQMKQNQEKNIESKKEYDKKRYREQKEVKQWYKLYNFTLFK